MTTARRRKAPSQHTERPDAGGGGPITFYCDLTPMASPRRVVKRGVSYMPTEYVAWKKHVAFQFRSLVDADEGCPSPARVSILLHEWSNRCDLDNYAKSILDALSGLAWPNDNCKNIVWLCIRCDDAPSQPGFTVHITKE